ncbi:hypothetical protein BKA63DRAFT_256678 [Paraphoma chrysanthemicola]|nr:hypothetical protein BKA63DRAFT_256678 [Paraphoma chrysanthemicola]
MAPFRNRDRSNRSGRGQIEHNVLEGLPINQYREVEITVGANLGDNKPIDKDAWPELPMPRDSHMLPEHSQQLLRAARAGRILKAPAPPEDDNEMKDEEEESKEVQTGFTIKKYVKVARHLEAQEPEYLAKRRKGLPSQYALNGIPQAPLRETKVKKLDAEGNATVYKVLVPEGQAVEGEVQPTDAAVEVAPATAAPGTIVEGVGIVNAEGVVVANDILTQTPPRRRPPPPKKKKNRGGPGRGRKKVVFAEGGLNQGTSTPTAGGDLLAAPGIKQEGGSVEPSDGDTPMGEAGADDEEGSGEEGSDEEDHEGDAISNPATPATPSRPSAAPTSVPNLDSVEIDSLEAAASAEPAAIAPEDISQSNVKSESPAPPVSTTEAKEEGVPRDPSSSPDLPLSAISHSRQNSLNQLPTSITSNEAEAEAEPEPEPEPEPMSLDVQEPILESAPDAIVQAIAETAIETIAEPIPAEVTSVPAAEANEAPIAATAPEVVQEEPAENPSAPASEPDLMASLDRHLEKDSEDIVRS